MGTLLQDIRYSLRTLRKSPGFTTVAILTLVLGIGANTAIFSIVNSVLLRSLPYPAPDGLVKIIFSNPGVGLRDIGFTVPELEDLKNRSGVFEDVSVIWGSSVNMMGAEHPERLELLAVSPSYFSILRVIPQIGRLFDSQDFTPGFTEAVVISDALWSRDFGRDRNILGRKILFDNDPYTIVGVLPPGFRHPGKTVANDVEVWAACGFSADPYPKPARNVRFPGPTMGRLKPRINLQQAQARLNILAGELRNEYANDYPAAARWSIEIQPLQESLVGNIRPMLLVLMAAAILIVLIASVNIANLLLARASGRQQEIAIRLALGASRGRVVRQMLTESVILSLIGGLAGVLTAAGVLGLILRFVPFWIPRFNEVNVDWVVLGFALLMSIITGLMFGLAPAIQSAKASLSAAIREGSRGSGSRSASHLRGLLIVSELALAVVLMIAAGLLLRTYWSLLQESPGFNPSQVVAASFWLTHPNDPRTDAYPDAKAQTAFTRNVLQRVREVPGVELASMTTSLPMTTRTIQADIVIEDRQTSSADGLSTEVISVSPDYFRLLQASLVQGRFFEENDETMKREVVIVDENTARRYWPNQEPIGRRIRLGQGANARLGTPSLPWMTVVGVIKNIKHDGLDADGIPHVYRSLYQYPSRAMSVLVRTSLPATALEPQIQRAIWAVDPHLPVFGVRSFEEVIDVSLAPRRFSAELVGAFAVLALLLSSVGIYGLLAFMVGQRSREIGIRVAMGAKPSDVLKLILGQGILLAGAGTFIGLLSAALIAPLIATLLWGIRPFDPIVFVSIPLLLLAVAFLASYIPARRATKVDALIALREA